MWKKSDNSQPSGGVLSVNGVTPDERGNVTISASGGGISSSNDFLSTTLFKRLVDFSSTWFRIPFMCTTKNGTIIAGSDIRYNSTSDFGKIDIGVARSTDGGKTWTDKKALLTNTSTGLNARVMDGIIIYDNFGTRNNIHVFGNKLEGDGSWMSISDKTLWDVVYKTSTDDGVTWSAEKSIKSVIDNFPDRKIFLGGVGSGIVMSNGTLVLPVQVSKVNNSPFISQSGIVYSSDNGATWQMSQTLVPERSSECNVVEYETGKLLLNARNDGSSKRVLYYTTDMGTTWTANASNSDTSPQRLVQINNCMASMIKVILANGKVKILYCAPHNNDTSTAGRANVSVMVSSDRGENWKMIASIFSNNTEGYSCLSFFNNRLYVVMEIGGDIIFKDVTHLMPLIYQDEKVWIL